MSKILGEHVSRTGRRGSLSLLVAALLGIATMAALCTPGGVAPYTWGETRASTLTTDNEYGATGGAGPNGEIYVAYWHSTGGGNNYILAVDANGIYPEGGPVFASHTQVNDGGAFVQASSIRGAALAVAPNGDIYAAWIDTRDLATTGRDIRIARSTDGGATFGTSVRVSDYSGVNFEDYPGIAVAANGDVWVTWADDRLGDYDVMVSRSTDGGATWSSNTRVNDVTVSSHTYPRIAIDSTGSVYVTWTDWRMISARAYYDFTRDNAATWNGNTELTVMGTTTVVADIGVDSHDILHAAWQDFSTTGIWYRHSLDRGLTWSMPVRLDDGRDFGDPIPTIAFSDDGEVYVTWEDRVGGNPYIKYVQGYEWGFDWSYEYQLISAVSFNPAVAVDNNNNVIWTWTRDEGAPYNAEAYVLFWDAQPHPVKNVIATITAPGSVSISWTPGIDRDLAAHQIAIIDGQMFYELVAIVPVSLTTCDLTGLANGEHSYAVMAVDIAGQNSQPAFVTFGLGPTLEDQINVLQGQLNDLQDKFDQLNTSTHDAITGLQGDLVNLQNQNNALQGQLTNTKDDLKDVLASSQNLNMMLMIVIIVLLIITMVLAARRPKVKAPEPAPTPTAQPPPPRQYQQPPPPQYPPQQPPPYSPP